MVKAYEACRRGKQSASETQAYSAQLLDHLLATRDALNQGDWRPGRSTAFICTRPKLREIHAAPFADRVVHHLLVARWSALYEPVFIHHSYANRLGKGSHAAVARLQRFMRQAGTQGAPVHALKLDIASFFHSIDRARLGGLLAARLRRELRRGRIQRPAAVWLWRLSQVVLDADPAVHCTRLGPARRFAAVPAHKRLGAGGPGIGLPIGNLSSQFFGNVVLDRLDQFVKHQLGVRYYLRYVDDFVLLANCPIQLANWRSQIDDFLQSALGLRLRDAGTLQPVSAGVDFLGFIVRPRYRLVRRRIVRRCWSALAAFERQYRPQRCCWRLPLPALESLSARLNSWLGHFRHADAGRLWQRLCARFGWLAGLFRQPETALTQGLTARWRLPRAAAGRSLRQQVSAFASLCEVPRWLVQVGRRWWWMQAGAGRPLKVMGCSQASRLAGAWQAAGQPFGALRQHGWQRDGRRQRSVFRLFQPAPTAGPAATPIA